VEKRGLSGRLEAEESLEERPEAVFFGDEMRLGLIGQVRRRWAPRGVKIRQPVEFTYEWAYLNLAVNPMEGSLKWDWTSDMKAESIAPVLESWKDSIAAMVWDGARGHQGAEYDEACVSRIQQPPYSPELQPVERIFQYLRGRVEGIVYGELDAKKEAVESELRNLAASPEKVQSLTCWDWIERALTKLSDKKSILH